VGAPGHPQSPSPFGSATFRIFFFSFPRMSSAEDRCVLQSPSAFPNARSNTVGASPPSAPLSSPKEPSCALCPSPAFFSDRCRCLLIPWFTAPSLALGVRHRDLFGSSEHGRGTHCLSGSQRPCSRFPPLPIPRCHLNPPVPLNRFDSSAVSSRNTSRVGPTAWTQWRPMSLGFFAS